jgi:hypothetical protein
MIIALSIIVGILVAWLLFSSFFSDSGDLWDGIRGFFSGLFRRSLRPPILALSDSDDGDLIPGGLRFFLLLVLSGACGYMTYIGLHKLFR